MAGEGLLSSPPSLSHPLYSHRSETDPIIFFPPPPSPTGKLRPSFLHALYAAVPTCGGGRFGFGWVTFKWTFLFPKSWRLKPQFQLYGKSISSFFSAAKGERRCNVSSSLSTFTPPPIKASHPPSYLLSFFSIEISALFDVGRHPPHISCHPLCTLLPSQEWTAPPRFNWSS